MMFASTVNLQPIYDAFDQALVLLITGLITAAVTGLGVWLRSHLKFLSVQKDAAITTAFNSALQNGANIAVNELEQYEGQRSDIEVKSWIAAKAAQYAIDHNQDFMKRFTGMDFDGAARKALAYVQPLAVDPTQGTVNVGGTVVKLGQPSPAGINEQTETSALNNAQAAKTG